MGALGGPVQSGGGVLLVGYLGSHCADGGGGGDRLVGISLVFGVSVQRGLSALV